MKKIADASHQRSLLEFKKVTSPMQACTSSPPKYSKFGNVIANSAET
jgi:hypothetical protein